MSFSELTKYWPCRFNAYCNLKTHFNFVIIDHLWSVDGVNNKLDDLSNSSKVKLKIKLYGIWKYEYDNENDVHFVTVSSCPFYGVFENSKKVNYPKKFFKNEILLLTNLMKYKFDVTEIL